MHKIAKKLFLIGTLGFAMAVNAQNLDMSGSNQSASFDASGKPTRGMSQTSVQENYGAPQNSRQAVGDPPITRWEYAGFVVFFEFDKVIHSVSK
jgi:hypothetical protein